MMRPLILILSLALVFPLIAVENNDFYDNTPTTPLKGPGVEVTGEIANPGPVDFSNLPLRSVMVREAVFQGSRQVFIGSYRYQGYSLFDILKERYVEKKNKEAFGSVIDLMVVVENNRGEQAVFSWGEIFYPTVLHQIILAQGVSPILPSKTKDQWPIPENTKLVCAHDLISERNLENPVKIMVRSCALSFPAKKTKQNLYSPRIRLKQEKRADIIIDQLNEQLETRTYPSVFYGRGRGFHGIRYFQGKPLKSLLEKNQLFVRSNIRNGYYVVSALDGYRVVISFSELFNRNDQADFLIIDQGKNSEKGRFRLFPTPDFFSDRAVHTIDAIHFLKIN